jgi:hypothetical protein
MKVIIAGSRTVTNNKALTLAIQLAKFDITEVVCGCAPGPDTMGRGWAIQRQIPVKLMPPDWEKYGKRAGYVRNEEMAKYADALIAIWDGHSRGTLHMVECMVALQKKYYVHQVY